MDGKIILERLAIVWKAEGNVICLSTDKGQLLLNQTVKEIWELLDGERTIDDINRIMIERYQEENSLQDITDIVNETIELLLENDVVAEKEQAEFDGWIKYE